MKWWISLTKSLRGKVKYLNEFVETKKMSRYGFGYINCIGTSQTIQPPGLVEAVSEEVEN